MEQPDFSYFDSLLSQGLENAIFDLDNTLVRSNIANLYCYIRKMKSRHPFLWNLQKIAIALFFVPYYFLMDRYDRTLFQKRFYKNYERFSKGEVYRFAREHFQSICLQRLIPIPIALLVYLKEQGVRVSIVSTSFDCVVKPFASYFDVPYECLKLKEGTEKCVVDLSNLAGFKRGVLTSIDPDHTLAVADSIHDLPILSSVRWPVVVSTRKRNWMSCLANGKMITGNRVVDL